MSSSKPVPGFPGYTVSRDGTVRGPDGMPLSPRPDEDGYERVDLRLEGKRFTKFVHTLVESAFGGSGSEVDHKDGNRKNNHADNLETVSHQENMNRVSENYKKNKS
jgi:HNH endonuclease